MKGRGTMKFVLVPDSFKESMTAKEVCQAMAKGIKRVLPEATIIENPMADGGEGTLDALVDATDGKKYALEVVGPLHKSVTAYYGILGDKKTAVIEVAQASGLTYVPENMRTPKTLKDATTYGTGQLINEAIKHGATQIILGLGGSGTNDGGSGMAQALGVKFLDKTNQVITKKLGGGDLGKIADIDISELPEKLLQTKFLIASDVKAPLTGSNGTSLVFGPQKGADHKTALELDQNLAHFAHVIKKTLGKDIENISGSGAAGGIGGGLLAFTDATIYPGVQLIADQTKLEEKIKDADFVFTGEGSIDQQTEFGKTPFGVAQIAQKHGVPTIAMAGYVGNDIEGLYEKGFSAIFGILDKAESLEQALKDGPENITRTTENIIRLLNVRK